MRTIDSKYLINEIAQMCSDANLYLPEDIKKKIKESFETESSAVGKNILMQCLDNIKIAETDKIPLCQDTGFAVFFVEMGTEVRFDNNLTIEEIINKGVAKGYTKGYLRKSIVDDPLYKRENTKDNTPAVVHTEFVKGDSLKITFAPKGGGSENMSAICMMKPSQGEEGIIKFVTDHVKNAGGNPCPPVIVGIGIGGTFEKCAYLAKKALLRDIGTRNKNKDYAKLEEKILSEINKSDVGPQGLGGNTTALDVFIEYYPCHIASMPVAVNLNCHVARHITKEF